MQKDIPTITETPLYNAEVAKYEILKLLPVELCTHTRIYQDEPRDGGGAYYRCMNPNCAKVIDDPSDWEAEHNKAWDWWD